MHGQIQSTIVRMLSAVIEEGMVHHSTIVLVIFHKSVVWSGNCIALSELVLLELLVPF